MRFLLVRLLSRLPLLFLLPALQAQTPDWCRVLDAPPGFSCQAQSGLSEDTEIFAAGNSSVKFAEGGALTLPVNGPGLMSFRWRLKAEPPANYLLCRDGTLELARFTGGSDWSPGTVLVGAGTQGVTWSLPAPILCRNNVMWLDEVQWTGVTPVTVAEALDYNGTVAPPAGFQAYNCGAWAADGLDALVRTGTDNSVAFSTTQPGWLKFQSRGSATAAWSTTLWDEQNLAVEADPSGPAASGPWSAGLRCWVRGTGTVKLWVQYGLDAVSMQPGTTVPLAEAADFPGAWSGAGYGRAFPEMARDGVDCILIPGVAATLSVAGPGILKFHFADVINVSLDGSAMTLPSQSPQEWLPGSVMLPSGQHTVSWTGSGVMARLDNVSREPLVTSAAALDYAGTVIPGGAGVPLGTTDPALAWDGQDCLLLGAKQTTSVRVPLTGPGRLHFRYRCEWARMSLSLGVRRLAMESAGNWQIMEVDVPAGAQELVIAAAPQDQTTAATIRDRVLVDDLQFMPGSGERFAARAGAPAGQQWMVISDAPVEMVPDAERPGFGIMRMAPPVAADGSALVTIFSESAGTTDYRCRLPASSDARFHRGYHPGSSVFQETWENLPPSPGWQDFTVMHDPVAVSKVFFYWSHQPPDQSWELAFASATTGTPVTLAEALDSALTWSASSPGWTGYAGVASVSGGDAALICATDSVTPSLSTTVAGPGVISVAVSFSVVLRVNGVNHDGGMEDIPGDSIFRRLKIPVGPGSHTVTTHLSVESPCGAMDDFKMEPWAGVPVPSLGSSRVTFATSGALAPRRWSPGLAAQSHDGAGWASVGSYGGRIAGGVEGPGFLTWWWKSDYNGSDEMSVLAGGVTVKDPRSTLWVPEVIEIKTAGFHPVFGISSQPFVYVDEFDFTPRAPVSLDAAVDAPGVTLTASADWSGFSGAAISRDGEDAAGLSTSGSGPHTITGSITGPGTLSFWWRRVRMGGTGYTPGTFNFQLDANAALVPDTSAGLWTWQQVSVPAGSHTIKWTATGTAAQLSGVVWLDSVQWVPGAAVPTLAEGLDQSALTFTNTGWSGAAQRTAPDGVDCAYTVYGTGSSPSRSFQTVVTGPAGVRCKVMLNDNSEPSLSIQLDGKTVVTTGQEAREKWAEYVVPVPAGEHTVRWLFPYEAGAAAFVDQVVITPAAELAVDAVLDTTSLTGVLATGLAGEPDPAATRDGEDALLFPVADTARSLGGAVPGGSRVAFWWRAGGHPLTASGALEFRVAGQLAAALAGGAADWQLFTVDLPPAADPVALEWRVEPPNSLVVPAFRLDQLSITPSAAAVSLEQALDLPEVTWLPGSAWYSVSAPAADGLDAAASAGPAQLEADVTGPGILLFDWAGPALEVSLNGSVQRARADGTGPAFSTGAMLTPPAGFRTYPLEIPPGIHRLRIASAGVLFLDRCRFFSGAVPPAEAPMVTAESFLLAGAVRPGRSMMTGHGLLPVTDFVRTANNTLAECTLPIAGPGVLGFRWDTDGTRQTVLLDNRRLNTIYSGSLGAWDFVVEVPPGVHTLRLELAPAYNQPPQFRLSSLTWEPGSQAYSDAAGYGVQWSSVGRRWFPGEDRINSVTGAMNLLAHFTGPAMVQWREPFATSAAPGSAGRQGPVFQHFAPFSGEHEIQWGARTGAWVRGLTVTPLTAVPLLESLDAGPGIDFSVPAGSDWTGYPVAGAGLTGDDAAFAIAASATAGAPLEAVVHGPGTLAFDWGLVAGMDRGQGTLHVNGLRAGNSIWLRPGSEEFTRQSCHVDLSPGPHRLAWTGSGFFLDHPRLLTADRRLATALDAPELQFSLTARDGSATESLILTDSGRDATGCVRLRSKSGTFNTPPDELRVILPGYGILRWQERTDALASWQAKSLHVEAGGYMFQTELGAPPRWIDDISFTPADRYLDLVEAVDAPYLPWEFSPGSRFESNPPATADGVDCLHIPPGERVRVQVSGEGVLRLRVMTTTYQVRMEVNGQNFTQQTQPYVWTLISIPVIGHHRYRVDFINDNGASNLSLDTVEWLPPALPPAGADALTDSDGDGVPALLEFAFGLNPYAADARAASIPWHSGVPAHSLAMDGTGTGFLEMIYVRRTDGSVVVTPEFSSATDNGWQPAEAASHERISPPGCRFELWRVRDTVPVTSSQRRFGRVRVQTTPTAP